MIETLLFCYWRWSELQNDKSLQSWAETEGFDVTALTSDYSSELVAKYINVDNPYIIKTFSDDLSKETYNVDEVRRHLLAWFNSTYPRYKAMLDAYASEEANILKGLETIISSETSGETSDTTTSNREGATSSNTSAKRADNDLPQTANFAKFELDAEDVMQGGYRSEDSSTGTTSDSDTTTSDGTVKTVGSSTEVRADESVIHKLDSVRRLYRSVYADWYIEFTEAFRLMV